MNKKELEKLEKTIIPKLKKEFNGLPKDLKKLNAYKIIRNLKLDPEVDNDSLLTSVYLISKAADCNLFGSLIMYILSDNDLPYRNLYSESLIKYNNILEHYSSLAQKLNINTSLELSHFFSYLLWNGYFSVDKTHTYRSKGRLLLPSMHSFDVIKGQGVCLAYSNLLHDFLNVCGKTSAVLNCQVPTSKNSVSYTYRPEIERNTDVKLWDKITMKSINFLFFGIEKKIGNHAITLIKEGKKLYIYDATNLSVLNVENKNKANIINGKGTFSLKPNETFLFEPTSDPNNLFNELLRYNNGPCFNRKDIITSFEYIVELLDNNKELLDMFYTKIHNDLKFINNQTKKIGNPLNARQKLKTKK